MAPGMRDIRGIYRDGQHVAVDYGRFRIPIPMDTYHDRGYEPPLHDLPTRDEYEAKQQR